MRSPESGSWHQRLIGRLRDSRLGQWLGRHEFAKHVLTLMTGTAFAQVLGLLIYPIVTRVYSAAEMGVFNLLAAVVGFLITIAGLRYEYAIVPARSDDEARTLISLTTRTNTAVSVTATVLLLIFAEQVAGLLNTPRLADWLWLAGPMVFLAAQVIILTQWLNRKKYYRFASSNQISQSLTMSASRVGLGFAGGNALGLVGSQMFGHFVALLRLIRRVGPEVRGPLTGRRRDVAKKYRRMPLLNGPNAMIDAIRLNGIPLLNGRFFSLEAIGNFGVAWLLIQAPLALINGALSQVFFQRMSVTPRGEMFSLVKRSLIRSLLLGIVPFALIFFLAPRLLPWVLGNDYVLVGDIAAVLVPWLFLNLATSPVSMLFIVVHKQATMLVFSIAYMVTPLTIMWFYHPSIVETMTVVSLAMAGLLVCFSLLALLASHAYDAGRTPDLHTGTT
ncbi:lipopolysaccharide biosynthesis protein [Tessaracoccus sp. Z1128]